MTVSFSRTLGPVYAQTAVILCIVTAYFRVDASLPARLPCRECRSVWTAQLLCYLTIWVPDVMAQVFGSRKPSAKRGNFKEHSENLW